MEWWHAVVLGVVQGATEFLPVSSSGHLRMMEHFTGLTEPQTAFDVALHVGTLLAVVLFFRKDVVELALAPVRAVKLLVSGGGIKQVWQEEGVRGLAFVLAGSVPTALIALPLAKRLEAASASLSFLGVMFILNSLILLASRVVRLPSGGDRMNTGFLGMRMPDALVTGVLQGVAAARGVSRSGSTISAALMMGVDRKTAGKFSFLLSLPAIGGAAALSAVEFQPAEGTDTGLMLLGGAIALISGAISLKLVMSVVERGRIHRFGWYTLCLGALLIAWQSLGLDRLIGGAS